MRVVHCKVERYDVYIGRGRGSIWGNPFEIGPGATREQVIARHRDYVQREPWLMARLNELLGKTIACWCKTKARPDTPCHGDTLVEFAQNPPRPLAREGAFNAADRLWCYACGQSWTPPGEPEPTCPRCRSPHVRDLAPVRRAQEMTA